MDSVNNRSLFRKRSQAARDKVREMGMVRQDQPSGILASFSDLMEVANRDRARNLMPPAMQQVQPMQRMPMQGPMVQQPQPVRMQVGGDVALEAYRQRPDSMPMLSNQSDPTLAQEFFAAQSSAMTPGVDIGETPTPRARVRTPSISEMVRQNIGDNPEAQARYDQLEEAITNPDISSEQVQEEVTEAAGVENTPEGFRQVAEQITGTRLPSSATVDEINNAITGVALGGAIGGPRSVAERISNALLVGLEAKRETAAGREAFEQRVAIAAASGDGGGERQIGPRSSTYRSPINAYQDALASVSQLADYEIPEGMTREQYGRQLAEQRVRESYTPEQLVGTQFEGIHSRGAAGAAPATTGNLVTAQGPDGTMYYSEDGQNFYDALGNPYVEPAEGE